VDNFKALDVIVDSLIRDPRLAGLGGPSKSVAVVAELIAQDLSNKEIGRYLGVAEDGARILIAKVYEKLGAQTRPEAIPGLATFERGGVSERGARG
jgi:Bacterial regulatory proteins, luxR family